MPGYQLKSGADALATPRKILNLWTETEYFHLGHLHMLRTAQGLLSAKHSVTFYIGEFFTDLWTTPEFRRREEQYGVTAAVLEKLVPGASTKTKYSPEDYSELVAGSQKYMALRLAAKTDPPAPEVLDEPFRGFVPLREDLLRIMKKPWGGERARFFPVAALYLRAQAFDALLIAERHEYIGRALTWFAKAWLDIDVKVLVVENVLDLQGEPMANSGAAIRVQEPNDYIDQQLQNPKDDPTRKAFIKQVERLFFHSEKTDADFSAWWANEEAALTASPCSAFAEQVKDLFESVRNEIYGTIPQTKSERHERVTNKVMLRYVGRVLKLWEEEKRLAASTPATLLKDIPDEVDVDAEKFESDLYAAAFRTLTDAIKKNVRDDVGFNTEVLQKLVSLTDENRTTDLFLFFAKKQHRDHYVHTFNVGALGQFLLDLHVAQGAQLKTYAGKALGLDAREVEITWWLTAMLHDHAYPLYSMMLWMQRLEHLAKAFPDKAAMLGELALPHISNMPSVHDAIKNPMKAAIAAGTFGLDALWVAAEAKWDDLFWFLRAAERGALLAARPVDHAFAAVLNIAFHLEELGPKYLRSRPIEQVLRGIFFHTDIILEGSTAPPIHWADDPMAYLLLVCDELQEWSRRMVQEKKQQRLEPTRSELLLSPLLPRLESAERWHLPASSPLYVTVRYFGVKELERWTSNDFHIAKGKIFTRLQARPGDPVPDIRLQYALASESFPSARAAPAKPVR